MKPHHLLSHILNNPNNINGYHHVILTTWRYVESEEHLLQLSPLEMNGSTCIYVPHKFFKYINGVWYIEVFLMR